MKQSEFKAINIEMSDMDKEHRTAIIAHAVYNNIDRYGDISRKGMFTKTWSEKKADEIIFDIDHNKEKQPGKVKRLWDNEQKAFTQVWFGTHTLGTDTMLMMDEGIIRGASFEFITEQKETIEIKGKKYRELKEVNHLATTVTLSLPPVNPLAKVESVTKAELKYMAMFMPGEEVMVRPGHEHDPSHRGMKMTVLVEKMGFYALQMPDGMVHKWYHNEELMPATGKMQESSMKAMVDHLQNMENFCRNTNASDDCIKSVLNEIEETKALLSSLDTDDTQLIIEPSSSVKEFADGLLLSVFKNF